MVNGFFDVENRLDYLTANGGEEMPEGYGCTLDEKTWQKLLRLQESCRGGRQAQTHQEVQGYRCFCS